MAAEGKPVTKYAFSGEERSAIVFEGITLFGLRRADKIGLRMLDPDSVLLGAPMRGADIADGLASIKTMVAIAATVAFVIRQRRAANPLYDLTIASRRVSGPDVI